MTALSKSPLIDPFGRKITYLRLSIVDRCNLRCRYCMPREQVPKLPRAAVLRLEEIIEVSRVAAEVGVSKFRITGGEPLIKKGAVKIVREVAALDGVKTVALTTNGQRLEKYADKLAEVGLSSVNVSLDSLDPLAYRRVTRGGEIGPVLRGIDAAHAAGLTVKINSVVMEAVDERTIDRWVEFALEKGVTVRFIERMGFDKTVPFVETSQLLELLSRHHDVVPVPSDHDSPHVQRFDCDGARVGFISPRSEMFCGSCNKLRLTAAGQLRGCLASDIRIDLRPILRRHHDASDIEQAFRSAVQTKPAEGPWTAPGAMWRVGG